MLIHIGCVTENFGRNASALKIIQTVRDENVLVTDSLTARLRASQKKRNKHFCTECEKNFLYTQIGGDNGPNTQKCRLTKVSNLG